MDLPDDLLTLFDDYDEDLVAEAEDEIDQLLDQAEVDKATLVVVALTYAKLLHQKAQIRTQAEEFGQRLQEDWVQTQPAKDKSPRGNELTQLTVQTLILADRLFNEEVFGDVDPLIDQLIPMLREDEGLSRGIFRHLLELGIYASLPRKEIVSLLEAYREDFFDFYRTRMYKALALLVKEHSELSEETKSELVED